MSELNGIFEQANELQPVMDIVESIMSLPDEQLNEVAKESIMGMITGALSPSIRKESVKNLIESFENQGMNRAQAKQLIESAKTEFNAYIKGLQPSKMKQEMIDEVFGVLYEIFDNAADQYHQYNIDLPILLDNGGQVPSYAHDGDAAADLYAKESMTLLAHTLGNKVETGVHIALPEGWVAYIVPRSSIGAKTPLRLSNSIGVIDSGYRGELIALYDNISDFDYTINAGDRIAQLIIMPSYRFKPQIVDILPDSSRGEGGFGSTGK